MAATESSLATTPSVEPPARRRRRRGSRRLVLGVVGILLFLGVWELLYQLGTLNPLFFAQPVEMVRTLFDLLFTGGALRADVAESAIELAVGFGIAAVTAVVLGVAIGWISWLDDLTEPVLAAFYATPYVAFLPLVIIWVGIGLWAKVVIVIWATFFPILINATAGVKNTSPEMLRVAESFCIGRLRTFRTIVLPSAVPYLLAGLRQAIGRALVGVIVAEFYLAEKGVGFFITKATTAFRPNDAFAAILLVCLVGVAMTRTVAYIERRVARRWGSSKVQ